MHLAPGKTIRLWTALAGLVIVALPVLLALRVASLQSQRQQERQAALLAADVLYRSEEIAAQLDRSQAALALLSPEPCSAPHLQLMARMTIENPLIVAFGHVHNDRLLCSSFGHHGAGLPVGPPDYRSRLSRDIRSARTLQGISGNQLLLSTEPDSGWTGIIHPDVALNFLNSDPHISLGVYNTAAKRTIAQRGSFDPGWIRQLEQGQHEVQFFGRQHIVALKKSSHYDFVAYAAIPIEQMDRSTAGQILLLVPLGMGAGFVLAWIIFRYTQHRMSVLWHLRQALKRRNGELFLVYQPVVDLITGRWIGAEALLRWRRADGNMVPPDIFIPMAERNQLIGRITAEVIRLFIHDLQGVLRQHPDFRVSLNFSASDLEDPAIAQTLHEAIVAAGLQHRNVQIEATERGLLNADQTRQTLRAFQNLGISVAIDDFGTGYSSLSYLTTLKVDCLKIDKSFVETIGTDAATSQVVAHIIEMGKSLGLTMVAEGVETEAQADYLRAHGVQYAQGWLFAKPLPAGDLIRRLEQQPGATGS